ncbi:hypothetical protein [Oleiagrimonas sp. MCCC 1A03011]|uniref:hypothetical protein n=1 Tax=Oleiagrimonas sp. MCCC 1A03011 TaxID=1926883 RepID=UPI000DC595D9|nr:hypothetical protein [Oleiagrimonas sp. MCCC 1A03011]RAP58388.1 hypothetical protein BTJ49_05420 [Oleiagrimonas sp. MCCC 1A03011]
MDYTKLKRADLHGLVEHVGPFLAGTYALRRGRARRQRALCFVAAIAVFLFMVSAARAHAPLGIFRLLIQ